MKVLHILFNGTGGTASVALSIAKSDTNKEFDHAILALGNTKTDITDALAGFPKDFFYQVKLITKKGFYDLVSYTAFVTSLWKAKPNCILLHMPSYLPFVLLYKLFHPGVTLIVLEHNSAILKTKYTFFLTRLAGYFSKKIGFQTNESYNEHIKKMSKSAGAMLQRKGIIIPNAIDDYFINTTTKLKDDSHTQLIMTSRLTAGKDHVTVVKAMAKLIAEGYKMTLVISGEGDTYDEIYAEVCKHGLTNQVTFLGYVQLSEIKDNLLASDIYVLSTQGETMSISMLEAMAMKIPIVGSRVFGVASNIEDGETGLLFEYQNTHDLSDALRKLIDDEKLYYQIQQNAYQKIIDNHTSQKLFERYASLIRG